ARREFALPGGARDGDAAGLERLAQSFQRCALELTQLIQKQNAVVGEGNFARCRLGAAADERGGRARVMRRAERALAPVLFAKALGARRGNHGGFERLGGGEGRQDAGQAVGEHALAGAGWTDKEEAVSAGGGDLERAAGVLLAAHVAQVR